MKVFLTGATGFLGSVLSRQLLEDGHSIRALRRSSSRSDLIDGINHDIDWIEGDVLDPDSLEKGMIGVEAVFHCAAHLAFEGSRSEKQLMRVNVDGTANVVNASLCQSVSRLVHISSIAALGRVVNSIKCVDETAEWQRSRLNTAYGISKFRAEMEVQRGVAEGLDAVITNPSLVMGPGRKGENTMQIAEKLKSGSIPVLPTGGTNTVDVEDVASGIIRAYKYGASGERYILSGHNLMWSEILKTLADALGVNAPSRQVSPRFFYAISAIFEIAGRITGTTPLLTRETALLSSSISCYDNAKARQKLGCQFRPFSETAARIADTFL